MQITDTCDLLKTYCHLARTDNNTEHCAIAVGKKSSDNYLRYTILDYCPIMEFGGYATRDAVNIPRKLSLALIRLCVNRGYVPIILHTHIKSRDETRNVSFSMTDQHFIDRFVYTAIKSGYTSSCLFFVTDGSSIMACEKSETNERYVIIGG